LSLLFDIIQPTNKTRPWFFYLFCFAIFLLIAVPKLNVKIGPVPFYFMDPILFITFIVSYKLPAAKSNFNWMILALTGFIIISEIFGLFQPNVSIEPIYSLIRTLLAVSIFFSARKLIVDYYDLRIVLLVVLVASSITGLLLIFTSIPATRGFLENNLFKFSFLEPATQGLLNKWDGSVDKAIRGRSLVGVSIMSGYFIGFCWPLVLFLKNFPASFLNSFKINNTIVLGVLLLIISIVMTYSRGPLLGLAIAVLYLIYANKNNFRLVVLGFGMVLFSAFYFIGFESEMFFFSRIVNSSEVAVSGSSEFGRSETERLNAYVEPFEKLIDHPELFLLGTGFGGEVYSDLGNENLADHAVFAKAIYGYGLIASLLYFVILGYSLQFTYKLTREKNNPLGYKLSKTLLLSILGIIPWFLFGHAIVSQVRGATLFYFLIALVSIQETITQNQFIVTNFLLQSHPDNHQNQPTQDNP